MFKLLFILITVFFISNPCISQEGGGKADVPKHEKSFKSKRKLAKADRKAAREKRKEEKAEQKKIRDYHKRIQTKEVRKRMKRSKVKAQRNQDHLREPFFQRLFQKKRAKGPKHSKEKTSKVKQN